MGRLCWRMALLRCRIFPYGEGPGLPRLHRKGCSSPGHSPSPAGTEPVLPHPLWPASPDGVLPGRRPWTWSLWQCLSHRGPPLKGSGLLPFGKRRHRLHRRKDRPCFSCNVHDFFHHILWNQRARRVIGVIEADHAHPFPGCLPEFIQVRHVAPFFFRWSTVTWAPRDRGAE